MSTPFFTEEDIRFVLTKSQNEKLTHEQMDTLLGIWDDIFDAILTAYTPAHAPLGKIEISAIRQIAMPYIKDATKEFLDADPTLSLAFCHTDQFDDQLQYIRTRKTLFMLAARSSGVSMDELSRITGLPKMTIAKQIDALDLTGINIADYSDYDKELPKLVADEREWEADLHYMHIRQAILMRVAHIKGMDIKTISRLSHVPPLTVAHQIQTLGL
jgi:hypothetical protein